MKSLLDLKASEVREKRAIRKIEDLEFAELCSPLFGEQKLSGKKLLGIRYEKACVKRVKRWFKNEEVFHNPWIRFADKNGTGFACPDIVLPESGIIFECKLSFTPLAVPQITDLYLPLCEKVFSRKFSRIIICKFWKGERIPELEILAHPKDVREFGLLIWSS
jgi:hypothetical protein